MFMLNKFKYKYIMEKKEPLEKGKQEFDPSMFCF